MPMSGRQPHGENKRKCRRMFLQQDPPLPHLVPSPHLAHHFYSVHNIGGGLPTWPRNCRKSTLRSTQSTWPSVFINEYLACASFWSWQPAKGPFALRPTGCLRMAQVYLEMVAENVRWKNQFEQVKCVEYAVNIP